jgi:hypothetical protein
MARRCPATFRKWSTTKAQPILLLTNQLTRESLPEDPKKMNQVIANVRIASRTEMDETLDAAIAAAQSEALADRDRGVLVTRHDFDSFSIALSPDVPFGLIREHDQVRPN